MPTLWEYVGFEPCDGGLASIVLAVVPKSASAGEADVKATSATATNSKETVKRRPATFNSIQPLKLTTTCSCLYSEWTNHPSTSSQLNCNRNSTVTGRAYDINMSIIILNGAGNVEAMDGSSRYGSSNADVKAVGRVGSSSSSRLNSSSCLGSRLWGNSSSRCCLEPEHSERSSSTGVHLV